MSSSFDLEPVDRVTAGAVGEPGRRSFYIQARQGDRLVTLLAEKQQVQLLAQTLERLLESLPEGQEEEGPAPTPEELELEEPLMPEWRAGSMALEYDDDTGRISIVISEAVVEEGEESEEVENREPNEAAGTAVVRIVATRAQVRALSVHALAVCAAGRPNCQLCGFPIDPEGHTCPALNGHREMGS